MRNNQWNKLTDDYKLYCNNWCCPCNDGESGCFANEYYMCLCENAFFEDNNSKFNNLLDESYNKLIEYYNGDVTSYEDFCKKFVIELTEVK